MFTNITWSTYFSYAAILCCAWYLFIAARYYRQEITAFALRKFSREPELNRPSTIAETPTAVSPTRDPDNTEAEADPDQLVAEVESLSLKLEEVVRESSAKGYGKEEFMFLLQLTIKEFPALDIPRCRTAVKSLIVSECEKFGFLLLSNEELDILWPGVKR